MQQNFPFQPNGINTATPTSQTNIALTAAVQQVTIPTIGSDGGTLRLVADGGTGLSWCLGSNANLTLANGVFMLPNSVETFGVAGNFTQLSVIGASAAGTFRVHVGIGQ